jgi:hypothetical protein
MVVCVLIRGAKEAAAAVESFEEGGLLQAVAAPEAVVAGEVVEAAGDELEGRDVWGVEDCARGWGWWLALAGDVGRPEGFQDSGMVPEGSRIAVHVLHSHERMWSRISPGRSESPAMAVAGDCGAVDATKYVTSFCF